MKTTFTRELLEEYGFEEWVRVGLLLDFDGDAKLEYFPEKRNMVLLIDSEGEPISRPFFILEDLAEFHLMLTGKPLEKIDLEQRQKERDATIERNRNIRFAYTQRVITE